METKETENNNFSSVYKGLAIGSDISLKAKGLLLVINSLPEGTNLSVGYLKLFCKESNTAISSALKELKDIGIISVSQIRGNNGKYKGKKCVLKIDNIISKN